MYEARSQWKLTRPFDTVRLQAMLAKAAADAVILHGILKTIKQLNEK
jgi:hypothetical protein